MPRITLDLHAAMDLAKTPEWADLDRRFGELDPHDKLNQPALIGMVRELVEDRAGPACRDLFHLVDDSSTHIHIFADFHCDEYGEITNDHQLSLSVMVGAVPLIMDPGIKNILDLPVLGDNDGEDRDELCAVSVLAAVVDYVNNMLRRVTDVFAPSPSTPEPEYTPLELRVVPVDGVRQFADPDFGDELSTAQRELLRSASDTDINDALAASWPIVEDRFHEIHDELRAAALDKLLN